MGLTDQYKKEVEKMTNTDSKQEFAKIQKYVDKGNFDTTFEGMFQHAKLKILKEKLENKN